MIYDFSTDDAVLESAEDIVDYYRTNPHYLAKDYFHVDTYDFQDILLSMMKEAQTSVVIASRGIGKSFITAVFACIMAVLYPESKIVIASYRRGQAINVLEKIIQELMPNSPELCAEIESKQINGTNAIIMFKNGSTIKVVTAGESGRSNRATLLIVDEYVLVKKSVVDDILRKFLTQQRMPSYTELTKEERIKVYNSEINKTIYLSSATFKDSWGYLKCRDTLDNMLSGARQFTCAFPYQLPIYEGLLNPLKIEEELLDSSFSQIKFDMEYGSIWYGGGDGAFFTYDSIAKTRNIQHAWLPDEISSKLNAVAVKIPPKKNGEVRILSLDVALMSSRKHNNDASSVFINSMMPTKAGRYMNNFVYTDAWEGISTYEQCLRVRRLFDMYQCDYIVLDTNGVGMSLYDTFIRDMVDDETGEIYPAISCCNDANMAARCTVLGAEKIIWSIKASAQFNSDCAFLLREGFRSGRIRLLNTEYDSEEILAGLKGFNSLNPPEQTLFKLPYIHTTLLVDELIKLQHEESGNKIRLKERPGMRKDRYSSLSYNYYVAIQLERKLNRHNNLNINSSETFIIKPPNSKRKVVNALDGKQKRAGWL